MKYAYIHPECGKPAFFLSEMPKPGDVCESSKATHLNGDPIKYGEEMECDSCRKKLKGIPTVQNIIEWSDE